MGINDRVKNSKETRKNAGAQKRKLSGVYGSAGQVADWESVPADLLRRAIAAMARVDGALRLGYSRDGGAYAVGIYGDGEPYTIFIPPNEGVEQFLEEVIEKYGKQD